MENGTKKTELPKHETIKNYIENSLMQTRSKSLNGFRENSIYGQRIKIIKIVCAYEFYWTEKLKIKFELEKIDQLLNEIEFGIGINSISGNRIFTFESKESYSINETNKMTFDVIFDQPTLVPGNYLISIGVRSLTQTLDFLEFVHEFSVKEINQEGKHFGFSIGESSGYIDTNVSVTTKKD
jgi:hypothetical protein